MTQVAACQPQASSATLAGLFDLFLLQMRQGDRM